MLVEVRKISLLDLLVLVWRLIKVSKVIGLLGRLLLGRLTLVKVSLLLLWLLIKVRKGLLLRGLLSKRIMLLLRGSLVEICKSILLLLLRRLLGKGILLALLLRGLLSKWILFRRALIPNALLRLL